jgi:bifunctional non-homologous end joining protein LigD
LISYLDPIEVERPPSGELWAHEIKWDGYRAQAHLGAGRATVYTRNGNDWTARFGPIAKAVELLPARSAILDGEAVAIDRKGVADFHGLRASSARRTAGSSTKLSTCCGSTGRICGRSHGASASVACRR